jgi:uncharacterized protein YhaN
VYGENEAGKSSALRAIRAALFGVPHQTMDDFRHRYQDLRVGAVIRDGSGMELAFVRRKGRKDTLLNADELLGPHPDDTLDRFLGHVDGDTFLRTFAIGHDELQQGGQELSSLRGLMGESLFAAGLGRVLGGASLADVLGQFESEASDLHGKRKSAAIAVAKKEYEQARDEKRRAELSSSRWQSLRDELEQARADQEEVREHLKELRTRLQRTVRIRNSLKYIAERKRLLADLDALRDVVVLPETYSIEDRGQGQLELRHIRQEIVKLERELHGPSGWQAQLARITVPTGLLEHQDRIRALEKRLGAHLKADHDMELLRVKCVEWAAQVKKRLRDLGLADPADVAAFRITSERRVVIQNLASDEKQRRAAPAELAARRRESERKLAEQLAQLDRLGTARDTTDLDLACAQTRKRGDLEETLAGLRQRIQLVEADAARKLKSLGLWNGPLADVVDCVVPLKETVERFETSFAAIQEQLAVRATSISETAAELADVRREILTLDKTEPVPAEQDLHDQRVHRDQGWRLVRRAWLEGLAADDPEVVAYAGSDLLANVYQQSVAQADALADRLRREADRVAHRAERRVRQASLEKRLADLEEQVASLRADERQLQEDWTSQWKAAGIVPLTPREMRGWLERHTALGNVIRELDELTHQYQRTEERYQECRQRVVNCLAVLQEPLTQPVDSLNRVLELAERLLRREKENAAQRSQSERDIDRYRHEVDALRDAEQQATEELAAWQIDWWSAMRSIGCPEDAPAAQVNERLRQLDELFKQIDDLEGMETRIQHIRDDARVFTEDVRVICGLVAPDLVSSPIEVAAQQLLERLKQAHDDHIQFGSLTKQIEKSGHDVKQARAREAELNERLAEFLRIAGVDAIDELPRVEQASQAVVGHRRRLREVESQLRELGGGLTIDQLVEAAEGRDADELDAEITELNELIERLDRDREDKAARIRELENACRESDGSAVAAEADQRGLGILSRIHARADRYLRLRLATALLRQQIEKYRAENQDPLLALAGKLFARLTCHEFAGLRTEYDERDQPVIIGVRANGEPVSVPGMSDGTRDQLYLALRLGYLERRLLQHSPLPLIVDDILVNFDDSRALATLQVLAELSRKTQIIFFTHHRHLVELAESCGSTDVFVHQLHHRETSESHSGMWRHEGVVTP